MKHIHALIIEGAGRVYHEEQTNILCYFLGHIDASVYYTFTTVDLSSKIIR